MRKLRHLFFPVVILALATALPTLAQRGSDAARPSPNAGVSQTIGTTEVTISYGRPGVKGRTIWGKLVPYGQVWRAGANEATKITFSGDVLIEGQKLSKGAYSFYTIPTEGEWTLIFNKVADQWGTNYDADQDALRVQVKPQTAGHTEWMGFSFEGLSAKAATVVLSWEKLKVRFKVEAAQ